jgi:hypothetical protein
VTHKPRVITHLLHDAHNGRDDQRSQVGRTKSTPEIAIPTITGVPRPLFLTSAAPDVPVRVTLRRRRRVAPGAPDFLAPESAEVLYALLELAGVMVLFAVVIQFLVAWIHRIVTAGKDGAESGSPLPTADSSSTSWWSIGRTAQNFRFLAFLVAICVLLGGVVRLLSLRRIR